MEDTLEIKRPKLLVADDSVTVRKVIELTFAEEGVDVFAVGDGDTAMKKFVEIEPDIVLADVNMPEPTGYHICEMIKQDETTHHIPVLLLVGSFEPFDQTEAERVGADGFLTKPFQSVRELVGRVAELLNDGDGIPAEPADTADIQNLFENSFAESYRTENEVRSNTFLGDAGMDDDLIETVYREGGPEPEPVAVSEDVRKHEMQGYDWMAEPAVDVGEPVSTNGDRANDQSKFERVVDDFDDTLEVQEPAGAQVETAESDSYELPQTMDASPRSEMDEYQAFEASEPTVEYQYQPPDVEVPTTEPEQVHEVEAATEHHEEVAAEHHEEAALPTPELHSYETTEAEIPSSPEIEEPGPSEFVALAAATTVDEAPKTDDVTSQLSGELHEELINSIAQRVIEKLSDRAVRDIAREAVPRIAEKLIREALDPENNKRSNS